MGHWGDVESPGTSLSLRIRHAGPKTGLTHDPQREVEREEKEMAGCYALHCGAFPVFPTRSVRSAEPPLSPGHQWALCGNG